MIIKLIRYIIDTTYLKFTGVVFMILLGGCWPFVNFNEHFTNDVQVKNSTKDTILLQIYIDSTRIKQNIPPLYSPKKLLPDSIVSIDSGGSDDSNYDPVQEYLKNTKNIEAYVIRKNSLIVKQWLKGKDQTGHSPYNPDAWKVNKPASPDIKGWIKFSIEGSDLEK